MLGRTARGFGGGEVWTFTFCLLTCEDYKGVLLVTDSFDIAGAVTVSADTGNSLEVQLWRNGSLR